MLEIILILAIAALLFVAPAVLIRWLARNEIFWIFTPANTFAIIVTHEDATGDGMSGAGNVVGALHGVDGKRLVKDDSDHLNWYFRLDEEDPDHQKFLFRTLGVQSMGNIFWKPRLNIDRRLRFAREEDKPKEELHTVTKVRPTKNVFYTGELSVVIKEADTLDKIGINFEIDFIFARKFPIRSVLRIADASAFLTSLVENIVNNMTSTREAEHYIGGPDVADNRRELVEEIEANDVFKTTIERELGLEITKVSLRDVTMEPKHRALLELRVTAEKKKEAEIIDADKEKQKQILKNDADADRIERVIKPAAQDDRTVAVRNAEAYENNKTVTTYAPGTSTMVSLGKH